MASEIYTFDTPGDFTYDSDKIEVSGGLAKLKDLTPADETFYASYNVDINGSRGLGVLTGTAYGGATVDSEKLDLAHNDSRYVDYDADLNADSQQIGCIRFKVTPNYTGAPSSDRWFFAICKQNNSKNNLIQLRHSKSGAYLRLHVYDKDGVFVVEHLCGQFLPTADTEYEIELNWDFTTGATRVFVNGVQNGSTCTNTCLRDSDIGLFRIGNDYDKDAISDFKIDYFQVFSTVQHTTDYTPVAIPETIYSTDKPTINPTSLLNAPDLYLWDEFTEVEGGGNAGTLAYQLSDNGTDWKYWNGSIWAAVVGDNYNSASVVSANIASFPTSEKKLMFKAILISDGEQKVELDTITIIYDNETPPNVYAGADKDCLKDETFKPFSDAVVSDVDGDIENATAWYDIEGSGYIQIPKGGYGTLQDAIRNFQYQYTNLGTITSSLKIIDEQSRETSDNLDVTVSNVTVTFNVRDNNGNHLASVDFVAGDGTPSQSKSSPFTYDYPHTDTYFTATFNKTGYSEATAQVTSTEHVENIVMASEMTVSYPITIEIDGISSSLGGTLENIVKGDSIDFTCTVTDTDISGWKIRCEIYDNDGNSIKLATANSGGSDDQIEITDSSEGEFTVHVDKEETTDFKDTARIEIEFELTAEKLITGYQSIIAFKRERIEWETP